MSELEFRMKREFWINVLKTITAAFIIGVVAGAANSYIRIEKMQEKVNNNHKAINTITLKVEKKASKREIDNLKEFLKGNFKQLNHRLDNIENN